MFFCYANRFLSLLRLVMAMLRFQALKYYNSQPFYTHRSGPVYTIPEDEEEPEEVVQADKYEPG